MQRYLTLRNYSQPQHLFVIWEFAYKTLPLYIWAHVYARPIQEYPPARSTQPSLPLTYYDDDPDALCSPLESLSLAVLEFLSVLTSIPQLQTGLRLSAHHLTNCLFHYMLLSTA